MKMAKSYKILIMAIAFVMSIVCAMSVVGATNVKAASASNPSDYFVSTVTDKEVDFAFEESNVTALMKQGGAFEFKNKLVVDDFELKFKVAQGISAFSINLTYDSFYVNGNKSAEGTFDKLITRKIEVANTADTEYTLKISGVENGQLKIDLNGEDKTSVDNYDKIRSVDLPNVKIGFSATTVVDAGAKLSIVSVDQKVSDTNGNFKQTFEVDADGALTDTKAYPRVSINDSFFAGNSINGYKAVKIAHKAYTLTLSTYSVLGNVATSQVYLSNKANDNIWLETDTELPKKISFGSALIGNSVQFDIIGDIDKNDTVEVYETKTVEVYNGDSITATVEDKKPEYVAYSGNELAFEAFEDALAKSIVKTSDDGVEHNVPLGTDLNLPSMEDLVFDNVTAYSDLKVMVYYRTADTSTSASELKFKLSTAGKYMFYAVFTDEAGNKMDADKIFDVDKDEGEQIIDSNVVFEFVIYDNAPIKVNTFEGESIGYKGVKFTAPSFKIDAGGCNTTYTLYYNPNSEIELPTAGVKEEDGWVAIPKASSITDKNYNENGYNYKTIQSIGYNGTLTFTPNKTGAYLIECTAVSETTSRSDTGYSLIVIENEPTKVKVPSTWLQDNVWSVVFLSIGTICLIGIIVLLCIKPKEETDED